MLLSDVKHCSLTFGDRVVLTSRDTVPDAEYALFDPTDIELSATGPGTTRETGYVTTAGQARARLARVGIGVELAFQAAAAVRPRVARAYARGAGVRQFVKELEAAELLDGRTFDRTEAMYIGAWLDLPRLSRDLKLPEASSCLQALHLAALLAECSDDETVALATGAFASNRRPGERTFKRPNLQAVEGLPGALRSLAPNPFFRSGQARSRAEIFAMLDEIAEWGPASQARIASIRSRLAPPAAPDRGPLAHEELWALETRLSFEELDGIEDALDVIERRDGRLPGTLYIRARAALIRDSSAARSIAERMSALSGSMDSFHELELLAAHAWAVADDHVQARAFARYLADNASASPGVRARAVELIDDLDDFNRSSNAPRPEAPEAEGNGPPVPKAESSISGSDVTAVDIPCVADDGAKLPALRSEPIPGNVTARAPDPPAELLVALSLPPDISDESQDSAVTLHVPRTAAAARFACTHLARELGRELNARHGVEIRADVQGLELSQRYLREEIPDGRISNSDHQRSIMRTGAFLSELLARSVAATWIDLESADPGLWAMRVARHSRPGEATRIWPIGRVLRFIVHSHKERDLVSYYLELEARAR